MAWAKALTLVVLASLTTACMQWTPTNVSGPGIAPPDVTSQVRITRADGSTVVLNEAMLQEGSITGIEKGGASRNVPLSDVQILEAWRLDPGFLFVPAIVVALVVVPRVFSRNLRETGDSNVSDGS